MPRLEPVRPPSQAVDEIRIRAPAQRNRPLALLIERVNADPQVKAWWLASAVNATRRLHMSDHSWVHVQIVVNIALRLGRLMFSSGVTPSVVSDYGLDARDAEVVIAAASLFHCVGMAVHRIDHEAYSLFL